MVPPALLFRPLLEATQGEEAWGGGGGGDGDRLGGWEAAAWIPAHRKRSGVRAGKEAGRTEGEGRPRDARQGYDIERAEARGRGGLFWKRLGRGTSKGHTSPVG